MKFNFQQIKESTKQQGTLELIRLKNAIDIELEKRLGKKKKNG